MIFLQRVLDLISSAGITKNKLLTDLGINPNAFVAWESRGTIPSGKVIAKIADYFHVSTDYLLGRTDDKAPFPAARADPLRSILLNNFDQLNQEGRERLVETSDDMVSSGKYIKADTAELDGVKGA